MKPRLKYSCNNFSTLQEFRAIIADKTTTLERNRHHQRHFSSARLILGRVAHVSGLLLPAEFYPTVRRSVCWKRVCIVGKRPTRSTCRLGDGSNGSKKQCVIWSPDTSQRKGQFLSEGIGRSIVMYRENATSAVQKRLNRFTSFGTMSGWAQGIVYYMSVHTGATCQIRLNDCTRQLSMCLVLEFSITLGKL